MSRLEGYRGCTVMSRGQFPRKRSLGNFERKVMLTERVRVELDPLCRGWVQGFTVNWIDCSRN